MLTDIETHRGRTAHFSRSSHTSKFVQCHSLRVHTECSECGGPVQLCFISENNMFIILYFSPSSIIFMSKASIARRFKATESIEEEALFCREKRAKKSPKKCETYTQPTQTKQKRQIRVFIETRHLRGCLKSGLPYTPRRT